MRLTNSQYNQIVRLYDERRAKNRAAAEKRKEEIYGECPRLFELDDEISEMAVKSCERMLEGDEEALSEAKEKIAALHSEREEILSRYGVKNGDFTPSYFCPDCRDTGRIGDEDCHCFKQARIDLIYQQSNLKKILEKQNFSTFSLECYSDEPWRGSKLTPRKRAMAAKEECLSFIEKFDTCFQNLVIYGDTGVGKTFLANCVAKELMDRGHSVIYFTANRLFDIFEKEKFRKKSFRDDAFDEPGEENDWKKNIYEAELLIIDDLGTELITSFTVSQLYDCINERILRERSTIISTNLLFKQLSELYSERIFSRLSRDYTFIPLVGDDLRCRKQA